MITADNRDLLFGEIRRKFEKLTNAEFLTWCRAQKLLDANRAEFWAYVDGLIDGACVANNLHGKVLREYINRGMD